MRLHSTFYGYVECEATLEALKEAKRRNPSGNVVVIMQTEHGGVQVTIPFKDIQFEKDERVAIPLGKRLEMAASQLRLGWKPWG